MTLHLDGPLLLAGAGNMGYALLAGWLDGGLDPARVVVQEPAPQPHIQAGAGGAGHRRARLGCRRSPSRPPSCWWR